MPTSHHIRRARKFRSVQQVIHMRGKAKYVISECFWVLNQSIRVSGVTTVLRRILRSSSASTSRVSTTSRFSGSARRDSPISSSRPPMNAKWRWWCNPRNFSLSRNGQSWSWMRFRRSRNRTITTTFGYLLLSSSYCGQNAVMLEGVRSRRKYSEVGLEKTPAS